MSYANYLRPNFNEILSAQLGKKIPSSSLRHTSGTFFALTRKNLNSLGLISENDDAICILTSGKLLLEWQVSESLTENSVVWKQTWLGTISRYGRIGFRLTNNCFVFARFWSCVEIEVVVIARFKRQCALK